MIPRIYQPSNIKINEIIHIDTRGSHHVAHVLRAKSGDALTLFNGKGGEFQAVILQINKKNVTVKIENFIAREAESPLNIYLAQGISRGEKMDFIVQKAVELGVKKIIPLITERSNVRFDSAREAKRLMHWQSIIVSACEQSGRNFLPEIFVPMRLSEWVSTEFSKLKAEVFFVLSPHAHNTFSIKNIEKKASIVLLIGPEGGLSTQEINAATQHGFISIYLGPRILRTETAPIAAISALQFSFGDMR